ncbi:MAG: type III-A CRISPR-associated protein Cas10/Csm1 [Synergistaceae bacterium]|nr:type III-A CRISPR-associated protein Cas10/Csm1 [Synergistaceae bacterium]
MKRSDAAAVGGLLHDVGKVIFRAGVDGRNHSVSGRDWLASFVPEDTERDLLDCVMFHHGRDIGGAKLAPDSPAYAVYIADNIAAGADRRERSEETEGDSGQLFRRDIPLDTVFNLMWGGHGDMAYAPDDLGSSANYPDKRTVLSSDVYKDKARKLKDEISSISLDADYINSLLAIMENILSFVPSSTSVKEVSDISLFDHSKITAAAAAAICLYLEANGREDFRAELLQNEHEFMAEKAFLMFSCDFSGIQKFIYNIASKNALKSLRSRSFVLEMLMEYLMDELIERCCVSRANLIYTGGGHSYLLLPNTDETKEALKVFERSVNRWLMDEFEASLYVACAWCECSGDDLCNRPSEAAPYPAIYRELSREIAAKKLHRYSPDELRSLNGRKVDGARECRICGRADDLAGDGDICSWCDMFAKISETLLRRDMFAVVVDEALEKAPMVRMPNVFGDGARYLAFVSHDTVVELHKSLLARRVYSKNMPHTGMNYSTNLYMGDYVQSKYMDDLAANSEGIKRIAILRADVDNLGLAFTSGFERLGSGDKDVYKTLSRSAAFSRQMSLFFKYHINSILSGKDDGISYLKLADTEGERGKNALIVYSGGDDIFLVGAWDDIIEAAVDIRSAFRKF